MSADLIPLMPPETDLPPAVRELRDDRQRRFVWSYMLNGANGAAAARAAGYSDTAEGCKVRAHVLLHRDGIQRALRELCTKYLFSLAPKALIRLGELLDKPDHDKHVKAIEMVLSRAGFAERTAIDVNVSGHVTVNHTDAALEDLRRLKALGVPRERLIETFGFSGLERYERMLTDQAKVIDGEAVKDG